MTVFRSSCLLSCLLIFILLQLPELDAGTSPLTLRPAGLKFLSKCKQSPLVHLSGFPKGPDGLRRAVVGIRELVEEPLSWSVPANQAHPPHPSPPILSDPPGFWQLTLT